MRKRRVIIIGAFCAILGAGAIVAVAQLEVKSRVLDTLNYSMRQFVDSLGHMTKFHEVATINGKIVGEVWVDGNRLSIQSLENGKVVDILRTDGKNTFWYSHKGEEEFALLEDTPAHLGGTSYALLDPNQSLGTTYFGKYPNSHFHQSNALTSLYALARLDFSTMPKAISGAETVYRSPVSLNRQRNPITYSLTCDNMTHLLKSVIVNRPNQTVQMLFDYPSRIEDNLFLPDPSKSKFLCLPQDDDLKIAAALKSTAKTMTRDEIRLQVVGCFRQVGTRYIALVWREFESNDKLAGAPYITRPKPPTRESAGHSMPVLYKDFVGYRAVQKLRMPDKVTGGYIMAEASPVGKTIDAQIPGIRKIAFAKVKTLQGKSHIFYNHKIELVDVKNIPVIQVSSLDSLVKRSKVKPRF